MPGQAEKDRPTLKDVANAAGVSPMTVSRAIRGSGPVDDQTKRRIQKAIAELGYVPNVAARQLVQGGSSDRVGLLIHNVAHAFWSRVAFAMQADLVQHGLASLVIDTHESRAEEVRQLERLYRQGVCGIIAVPYGLDNPLPRLVRERGLPLVILNGRTDGEADAAAVDEAEGIKQLTQHLLSKGYRKITLAHRAPVDFNAVERHNGFRSALQSTGIPFDPSLVCEISDSTAEAAISALLAAPEPPDAIVAAAPNTAFRVLWALGRCRIVVPDEMEVVVFGEMPTFDNLLTRASYEPAEDLGKAAAEMLVERINGYRGPGRQYVQPVRIIERKQ